jgi:hypothetical protein
MSAKQHQRREPLTAFWRWIATFALTSVSVASFAQQPRDTWVQDPEWEAPLAWLEKASAQSRPYMKSVMLPTEFAHVGSFLRMSEKEPMAVQYQPEFRVNQGPATPSCVIGRLGTYAWQGWLDLGRTEEERQWIRFWLVAHEWGHCLDAQDKATQKAGAGGEETLEDQQNGERRSDVFATVALIARTQDLRWFTRIAVARKGDGPTEVHYTYPVFERLAGQDASGWSSQSVHDWWQVAKTITRQSRP